MVEALRIARSELILGGQKSGKSRRAELLAQTWLGTSASHRAVLIATGQPGDEEMRQRIHRHQADRALRVLGMETVEEPLALAQTMTQYSRADTLVVVDCLSPACAPSGSAGCVFSARPSPMRWCGLARAWQKAPEVMQAMQAFMLGSTGYVGWTACAVMAVVWLACMVVAWMLSHVLDGLSLGEATAASLGLPLPQLRAALVAVLALATGTAVAQTGLIAFVGLAAPHLVRSVTKTTHGRLILLSSLMGGVLLMAADMLARGLMAPQELPVGVLTAVLGGGYLLWLMHRNTRASSRGGL